MYRIFFILLITLLTNSLFVYSQKNIQQNEKQDDCFIMMGTHKIPLKQITWINLPREEILSIDSLTITNKDYKVISFEISYPYAMGNLIFSNGSHFPEDYFKLIKSLNSGRGLNISYIKAIKNGESEILKTAIILTIDTTLAVVNDYTRTDNNIRRPLFFKCDTIKLIEGIQSNFKVISYDLDVISKQETKTYKVKGNTIPKKIKKYVWTTIGPIEIRIKNIIAEDNSGHKKQLVGINLQCKY